MPLQKNEPEEKELGYWKKKWLAIQEDFAGPEQQKDMDRAVIAQDAIRGNDEALQKLVREEEQKMGLTDRVQSDAYKLWSPEGHKKMSREMVRERYEQEMNASAKKNGYTRQELDYMVHCHAKSMPLKGRYK